MGENIMKHIKRVFGIVLSILLVSGQWLLPAASAEETKEFEGETVIVGVVSELNKQIQTQRKPWERELQQLGVELEETLKKLEKWEDLIKVSPELRIDLNDRIHQLELECMDIRHRTQELMQILHTEGYSIKLSDAKRVMGLVTQLLDDSDSKAAKKAILRTFIDRITVDKESKSDYKIYMKFDDVVIAKLNEQIKKEPTAGYAVALFLWLLHLKL